jgi:hypothetical protein
VATDEAGQSGSKRQARRFRCEFDVEEIMSTNIDSSAVQSVRGGAASAVPKSSDPIGRDLPSQPIFATVDVVSDASLAVTRPSLPRLFRFFLLLTGVKV